MTEETNRLNRLIPQTSSTSPLPLSISPHTARSVPVPSSTYAIISQTVDLRPTKPFERKLSPNSVFPLFDSGTDTMSSTTSKSSSRSQRGTGGTNRPNVRHHKTDPGFRPPVSAGAEGTTAVRNSPTKSSLKKTQDRGNSSLQEELLKLINPDLIDRDSRVRICYKFCYLNLYTIVCRMFVILVVQSSSSVFILGGWFIRGEYPKSK